jgi:hypothetical protein
MSSPVKGSFSSNFPLINQNTQGKSFSPTQEESKIDIDPYLFFSAYEEDPEFRHFVKQQRDNEFKPTDLTSLMMEMRKEMKSEKEERQNLSRKFAEMENKMVESAKKIDVLIEEKKILSDKLEEQQIKFQRQLEINQQNEVVIRELRLGRSERERELQQVINRQDEVIQNLREEAQLSRQREVVHNQLVQEVRQIPNTILTLTDATASITQHRRPDHCCCDGIDNFIQRSFDLNSWTLNGFTVAVRAASTVGRAWLCEECREDTDDCFIGAGFKALCAENWNRNQNRT